MIRQAYIALGSNLGVPTDQIHQALEAIDQLPDSELVRTSNWYRTEAIGGPADQPDYINAACLLNTKLPPVELLHALQRIEADSGRIRDIRWGPRTLDLDIIWYQGTTSQTEELTLPHPRAHERAFVLQPLLDLGAGFKLMQKNLPELLATCSDQGICKIDAPM